MKDPDRLLAKESKYVHRVFLKDELEYWLNEYYNRGFGVVSVYDRGTQIHGGNPRNKFDHKEQLDYGWYDVINVIFINNENEKG